MHASSSGGLTRSESACGAGPDASGSLIVGVLHSIPGGHQGAERRVASRSLRRTRLRGRLTATRPCRETHRGLIGTPALADCLWPVMDSRAFVAPGCKPSYALFPALLARFARSLRKGTPRDRDVEQRWFGTDAGPGRPLQDSMKALGPLAHGSLRSPFTLRRSLLTAPSGRRSLVEASLRSASHRSRLARGR